jgi:GrpB-like predicted nucleotidyltransferase (UPF0157 family)
MKIATFQSSEYFYPLAKKLYEIERNKIRQIFPNAIVEHVGGTSIPNALTLGDLDIQIKISQEEFEEISYYLKTIYHINHPEIWNDQLAIFHKKDHPELKMSIMLTVKDSPYDEYQKTRDYFINHPEDLQKYNDLKRSFEGKDIDEYKSAKYQFFGKNGTVRFK